MQKQPFNLQQQSGAVLIVALMMVLLITIVGLSAIRGSGLQEQMAGNMRDRNLAFQAAEAALRDGEDALNDGLAALPSFDGGTLGFYEFESVNISATGKVFWENYDWDGASGQYLQDIDKVSERPRYVVERVATLEPGQYGGAVDWASMLEAEEEIMYRVTSRAVGGTTDAVVMLQATYK